MTTGSFTGGQQPAYSATRTDHAGRPIGLAESAPRGQSVLFTGGPGMGKSHELNRAEATARQQGWMVFRVDASPREPLERRFSREVAQNIGGLRKEHGFWALRKLKKCLRELSGRQRLGDPPSAEVQLGWQPVQASFRHDLEDVPLVPRATLTDLADTVGDLADKKGVPAVLMVDNLEMASERDLIAVNDLAAHLERSGRPVYLVAAGGPQAITAMSAAGRELTGAETDLSSLYDIREVQPMTDDQLRPIVGEQLARQGIPAETAAVDTLVQSANGSPRRLQQLTDIASETARPPYGVTADVAEVAVDQLNTQNRLLYEATWNNSSTEEKNLLAQTAVRGQRGLSMPSVTQAAGPERFAAIDTARQSLKARGVLRESDGARVKLADPGMQEWIQRHVGHSAAHAGVSVPTPGLAKTGDAALTGSPAASTAAAATASTAGRATDGARPGTAPGVQPSSRPDRTRGR